jgi:hypothetical protein
MENECYFVNSRGLLKSCTFHSSKPISSCNTDTKYLFDMITSNKMFNGMSIYVCSDLLKFFVNIILPRLKNTFLLVSGDSDLCVPKEILTMIETNNLLNSQYLLKWFAQNTRIQNNDKIIQLPIGLDYHTIHGNPKCKWRIPYEKILPIEQETVLKNINSMSKPFYERILKIYVNFSKNSDRFKQRINSLNIIPKNLMVINNEFTPRTNNWKQTSEYTFVLSPFGIGMDCHRTWEALCLGCIPVVCAPDFKDLFEDLPVLIVNQWSEIDQTLLLNTICKFKQQKFNYDKLSLKYWTNQMNWINQMNCYKISGDV